MEKNLEFRKLKVDHEYTLRSKGKRTKMKFEIKEDLLGYKNLVGLFE